MKFYTFISFIWIIYAIQAEELDSFNQKRILINTWFCINKSDFLMQSEFRRNWVYINRNMVPAIGIGFNLGRSEAPGQLKLQNLDFNSVLNGTSCLNNTQIDNLFKFDLQYYEAGATQWVSSYSSQPTWIKQVLIDISFSMTKTFLWSWTALVTQINANNYSGAYSTIKASQWCKSFPERCRRDANLILYW